MKKDAKSYMKAVAHSKFVKLRDRMIWLLAFPQNTDEYWRDLEAIETELNVAKKSVSVKLARTAYKQALQASVKKLREEKGQ